MWRTGASRLDALSDRLVGLDDVRSPVVVACSGGADSLALLALAQSVELEPVAVHVDHGLRADSADEVEIVAAQAGRLDARFRSETVTVALGPNVEARARDVRYAALERARHELGAEAILVGHTADDQAETVVLNLLRGSATAGLGGMPMRRGALIRPMLGIRRSETEAVCDELGLDPIHDPTNDDRALRRNWIRHDVLPLLSAGAERDLVPLLARQAEILRDESEYLDAAARAAWPVDAAATVAVLVDLPMVVARRAVRLWLGPPPPSFDEVERVLRVARGETRATEISGGRRVWRRSGCLHADALGR
jgi:tRNA(Ile)-lysidine synthase